MNARSMEAGFGVGMATAEKGPQGGITLQPAGALWTRPALLLLAAMAVFASWYGQQPILAMTLLLLSFAVLCRLWSRHCLVRLFCGRTLERRRAFPGEEISMEISLRNGKWLALPWVRLENPIPGELRSSAEGAVSSSGRQDAVEVSLFLPGRNRARWTYRMLCRRRGFYPLGNLRVTSGDIFGLYTASLEFPAAETVLVYPRLLPLAKLPLPALQMLGDEKTERRICTDPTRPFGIRDHIPSDGLRHIHWKASARGQGLKRKIFEPTTTKKIALFFDVESFGSGEAFRAEAFELGISTVATVAFHAGKSEAQPGLYANTRSADTGRPIAVPPSGSRSQLVEILESLAKATPRASGSLDTLLSAAARTLPSGSCFVLVTGSSADIPQATLADLKARGYRITMVPVEGKTQPPSGATGDAVRISEASR
ncbi:MAG: hypothetical protein A4E73_02178 [Syntrophaceae bacterium PtaU1.Bin231]|nr:MAG: hypothetical protein A4E73_02178 [Syntrophaceae bacterium PtaU1.Bin231]